MNTRKSVRLRDYDYSRPGYYFITICIKNNICILSQIIDGSIILTDNGQVVDDCINQIPTHFENVALDYYCIMPNHLHLILALYNRRGSACRTLTESYGKPIPGSLPTIIRSLKSASTKQINIMRNSIGEGFWQRNYYEHIIRTEKDLYYIRKYIQENPAKWEFDEYFINL